LGGLEIDEVRAGEGRRTNEVIVSHGRRVTKDHYVVLDGVRAGSISIKPAFAKLKSPIQGGGKRPEKLGEHSAAGIATSGSPAAKENCTLKKQRFPRKRKAQGALGQGADPLPHIHREIGVIEEGIGRPACEEKGSGKKFARVSNSCNQNV